MKVVLEKVSANRADWLDRRSRSVGSSEIATIVGLNKYQTPLQLWMQKTGRLPPPEDNDAMRLGRLMESFIGEKFARDNNKILEPADVLLCHEIHDAFTASPDFWVVGDGLGVEGVVECKNVSYRRASEWADGDCPDHAQVQLQWQLAIAGLSQGYVAGLVGAQVYEFHQRHFVADSVVADKLFAAAHEFLQFVKTDTPPAAVAGDRDLVESRMGVVAGSFVELPGSALPLLERYEEFVALRKEREKSVKAIKSEEDSLRAQIELLLGDSSGGSVGVYSVEVKRINKPAYTAKPSSYVGFSVKKDGKAI